jgi:hypothetical protein
MTSMLVSRRSPSAENATDPRGSFSPLNVSRDVPSAASQSRTVQSSKHLKGMELQINWLAVML